jgi:hypothetical protein
MVYINLLHSVYVLPWKITKAHRVKSNKPGDELIKNKHALLNNLVRIKYEQYKKTSDKAHHFYQATLHRAQPIHKRVMWITFKKT